MRDRHEYHHIYFQDGEVYLDDRPLYGVINVNIDIRTDEDPRAQLELLINVTAPTEADRLRWHQSRMVTEDEWKKMMTEKAQEVLDGLSENQS